MPHNFSKRELRKLTIQQLENIRLEALGINKPLLADSIQVVIEEKRNPFKQIKPGKKEKAWTSERNRQKKTSLESNLMYCQFQFEGCEGTENLGYSHPYKRAKTTNLAECILACGACHSRVENAEDKVYQHELAKTNSVSRYYDSV